MHRLMYKASISQRGIIKEEGEKLIAVRTLYINAVNNYPSEIHVVYNTFHRYGKIRRISLHPRRVFFFITFEDAKAAARVLAREGYFRKRFLYTIQPADQWHQPLDVPDGTVIWDRREQDNYLRVGAENVDEPSLMDLNNDCLLHILQEFSLRELIRLEVVNKRIRSLCLALWHRITHLDFLHVFPWFREMRLDSFRELLLRTSSSLTSLNISNLSGVPLERCLPQIAKHCPYLTHLDISHHILKYDVLKCLDRIVGQLVYININKCCIRRASWEWLVGNGKNLVEIYACGPIPGISSIPLGSECLQSMSLKNLRILHMDALRCCLATLLKMQPLLEELVIFEVNPIDHDIPQHGLHRLSIVQQDTYPRVVIEELIPQLKNLRVLMFTCGLHRNWPWDDLRFDLNDMPKLKELYMHHWPIGDTDLKRIMRSAPGRLEKISCHGCEYIGASSLIDLIIKQPNLTLLNVSQLSSDVVVPIPHLESCVQSRIEPISLTVIANRPIGTTNEPLLNFVMKKREISCTQCSLMNLHHFEYGANLLHDDAFFHEIYGVVPHFADDVDMWADEFDLMFDDDDDSDLFELDEDDDEDEDDDDDEEDEDMNHIAYRRPDADDHLWLL